MNLRTKLFPALVTACVACLVALTIAQSLSRTHAAEESLRADAQWRAAQFARAVETERAARTRELTDLEQSEAVFNFFAHRGQLTPAQARDAVVSVPPASSHAPEASVAHALRDQVELFFEASEDAYASVTLVGGAGQSVVVRFEPPRAPGGPVAVKTGDSALGLNGMKDLLADAQAGTTGDAHYKWAITPQGTFAYVKPIVREADGPVGALIVETRLDVLVARAAAGFADADDAPTREGDARAPLFQLIALDRARRLVYHTNPALKFQTVARVMPYFAAVAEEMQAGGRGATVFNGADGTRRIAAYAPVGGLDLSVAVEANLSAANAAERREGQLYVALSVLLALTVVVLVFAREARGARRIERIAQAAQAVAEGDLDRRLEVRENDRTRVIAESFNLMTERLRAHIRREAEGRQFQAFMRLSAMLTHDLKNAITGLSMLVSNMERQFHREEFRADAVASLRDATDNLRSIVSRLSKPVETLSGEYRSALKPVDLSVVVRRVVETTAAQSAFHETEVRLSGGLNVVADVDRLERVFENLVINALDAMGASTGRLTIEGGSEGDDAVFVTVADTGAGMTPEFIRTKLFRPFATTKKQGLGLGLYTCREIVEAHGGRIEVESRPSSGTRFRVVLPSRPVSLPRDSKT